MPTYEYKCEACGHLFERFQSITAKPVKRCPQCGKAKVRRLISTGAGLIFKGSGFYITDYRDKSYTDEAKADGGGGSTETKAETKSESKGETKGETKSESKGETKTESKPAETPAKKSESKPANKSESKSRKK